MIVIQEEKKKPKTKPQVDKGGSGLPPRPTAIGMYDGGGDDDDNLNDGKIVLCKIVETDPRGFKVMILGSNVEAVLVTNDHFQEGRTVRAKLSYWSDSGVAMMQPTTRQEAKMFLRRDDPTFHSTPESFYDTMIGNDPNYQYEHALDPQINPTRPSKVSKIWKTPFGQVFANSVVRSPNFALSTTKSFLRRRTLDMFVAPIESSECIEHLVDSNSYVRDRLLKFKEENFTGCLIASNDRFFSRGGMLIYRGDCVGAVYSNNFEQNTDDTASAMRSLLMELYSPPATFSTYTLPEEIILPYSALLLGRKLENIDNLTRIDLFNKFSEDQLTGVISMYSDKANETVFVFIYDGEPSGFFMVQERKFAFDTKEKLSEIINELEISSVSAAFLPEEELIQTLYNPISYLPGEL